MIDLSTIDMEKDAAIVIKFDTVRGSTFSIYPANVSAAQMIMIGEILALQGRQMLEEQSLANMVKHVTKLAILELNEEMSKAKQEEPKIVSARGMILKPEDATK